VPDPLNHPSTDPALLAYLESFLTDSRRDLINRIASQRIGSLHIVLEDIFQGHNASAVLRSFQANSEIALGANKWLSLHRHAAQPTDNTSPCLQSLKTQGFKIVGTALTEKSIPLPDLNIDQPIALCFGTEGSGLSETALNLVDEVVQIPMYGFTQSFNISVSVAICLSQLTTRLRQRNDWQLPQNTIERIRSQWIRKSLKSPDALERRFFEEQEKPI